MALAPVGANFPTGISVGANEIRSADDAIFALQIMQTTPGIRGEVQIIPCDTGGAKDPFAGGELTLLMEDIRVTGAANSSALTVRGTRNGTTGEGVAWTVRSLSAGTAMQYPIEFDATDGVVQFKLLTDGKAWFYRQVQFEGHDDLPILRLGPQSQPAIDFEDSDSGGCTYRLRSGGGNFSIYNTTNGNVPFILDPSGRPFFNNMNTLPASGNTANVRVDPTTGQLFRLV